MTRSVDVLVVGGGVIGVCAAFSLAERGVAVTLVERGEIASGCSEGNAGWIFPSHALPLPAPGRVRRSLRWLLDPESPLRIAPRPRAALLRWLWRFRAACRESAAREGFRLRRALGLASLARYAELARLPGLEFGFTRRGLLLAFRTAAGLREAERELLLLEALGGRALRLGAAALRERAPALAPELAGGVFYPDDAHLDPARFVRGLAEQARRRGAELETGCEVLGLEWSGRPPARVRTARGAFEARELVLAAGAWTPVLARGLGLRLPVEPARGYSFSLPRPADFGEHPILLAEARVALTPLGDRLRLAGTLELAGFDPPPSDRRVRAIERAARASLPGLPPARPAEVWSGLRPLTPDDLPIIGRPAGSAGLVIATGHGMTGMALGPATGDLVAALVAGEPPEQGLAPFSPDRFARARAAARGARPAC